jgi:hypothetical protein
MNNIASPRNDDSAIEGEIRAKGLTAPRITPADIQANSGGVHYFTVWPLMGYELKAHLHAAKVKDDCERACEG